MGFPSGVSLDLSLRSEGNPQGLLKETGLVRVIFIMAIVLWVLQSWLFTEPAAFRISANIWKI